MVRLALAVGFLAVFGFVTIVITALLKEKKEDLTNSKPKTKKS